MAGQRRGSATSSKEAKAVSKDGGNDGPAVSKDGGPAAEPTIDQKPSEQLSAPTVIQNQGVPLVLISSGTGAENSITKKDRSAFIVMAKRSKDPNVMEAYSRYAALDRFDEKKQSIVALWKKDKSCNWWNGFSESQIESESVQKDDFAGYGTMYPRSI